MSVLFLAASNLFRQWRCDCDHRWRFFDGYADWDSLSQGTRTWFNAAVDALEGKTEIADFPDAAGD